MLIIMATTLAYASSKRSLLGIQTAGVIGSNSTSDPPMKITPELIHVLIAIATGLFAILGIKLSDIIKGLWWRRKYGTPRTPIVMPSQRKKT